MNMPKSRGRKLSRRRFRRLAGSGAAVGPFFTFPGRVLASEKTLKIAKWAHFLPEYDLWFEGVLAREWGEQCDTRVIIDLIPVQQISARDASEVKAGKGHDLFMFPWAPAEYRQHAIDHAEVYQTVSFRYGDVPQLGHKSTFDLKNKKYFAFADSWIPPPLHYFEDHWSDVNMPLDPVHYGSLRSGGQRIPAQRWIPCGLALPPTLASNNGLPTPPYALPRASVRP